MDLAALGTTMRYLLMPIVVLLTIVVLVLILRWSQTPRRRRPASRRGLLIPIARVSSQAAADRVASRLREHGIRTTSTPSANGFDVLVWQEEYGEARLYMQDPDDGTQPGG